MSIDVWRTYKEKGDASSYLIEYFPKTEETVGQWKKRREVNNKEAIENFLAKRKQLAKIDLAGEIDSISDHIDVDFTVRTNQPNPIFGIRNKNLQGKKVRSYKSGIRMIRAKIKIHFPLSPQQKNYIKRGPSNVSISKRENVKESRVKLPRQIPQKTYSTSQTRHIAYMLATINSETYVREDDITVTRFSYLLDTLGRKTVQTEKQIADMSVAAVKALREKYGKNVKLLSFMEAMNNKLAEGDAANYAIQSALYMQVLKR